MSNPREAELELGSGGHSGEDSGTGGRPVLGSVGGSQPGAGVGAPQAQSQQLEAAALRGLREAELSHEDVQMFNPLSDQEAETKFKRNKGGELELDADRSLERKEQRMDRQVEELEAARAKQDEVTGLAKKVVKKVSQKAGGA